MEQEELNRIWEDMENPPKGVKVKKSIDKITVKISAYNYLMSMVNLICLFGVTFFLGVFVIAFLLEGFDTLVELLYRRTVYRGIELPWFLILTPLCPYFLILVLRNFLWSVFGKIELVFGTQNYISQKIFIFGKKKDVNWKDILSYYVIKNKLYINIKDNKTLIVSAKYVDDVKLNYLFSIIKYFKDQNNA